MQNTHEQAKELDNSLKNLKRQQQPTQPGMTDLGTSFKSILAKKKAELRKRGIDVDHLPSKEELDHQTIDWAQHKLITQKQTWFKHRSLYSGNISIAFTFNDWKPELQDNAEQAKKLGNQAYKLAKQLTDENFNVAMLGTPGVGKTSLAMAMMSVLAEHGKTTLFISTAELLKLINDKFEDKSLVTKIADIKLAMTKADVLVLDDFGTEGGLKFNPVHKDMQELMYEVSNARVDFKNNTSLGATIITTNNTKSQLKMMYDAKFIDRVFPDNPDHQLIFEDMKGVRNV